MSDTRQVRLTWSGPGDDGHFGFSAVSGSNTVLIDGDSKRGGSPMEMLLASVGACMAIDVVDILLKSRVPLEALDMVAEGDRAEDAPRRYVAIRLRYEVRGPLPEHQAKLERAVALSREKYCSVLHTLRPDLDLSIDIVRV